MCVFVELHSNTLVLRGLFVFFTKLEWLILYILLKI